VQRIETAGPITRVPLSVLDFGQLSAGQTSAQALADTTVLARHADELGFTRFWVSEHHATPWLASTSPAVLLGHLAATTRQIRVGSGGVMLSNHPPLVVAEQFALLEALHPGRVDLGLGRAPGADPVTAAALRRSPAGLGGEDFADQVQEVQAMLGSRAPGQPVLRGSHAAISPTPHATSTPAVWLLGSSAYSARLAASLGLPFCFAGHNGAPLAAVAAVLDLYRGTFRSAAGARPHAMVSTSVLAAETEHEADRLARPGRLQRFAERTGRAVEPFLSPEAAARVTLGPGDEQAMAAMPEGGVSGTPDRVVTALEELTAATGADELLLCSFAHGSATRVQTLELVAAAWGLPAASTPVADRSRAPQTAGTGARG
jgi:luciferase family oxidoreductase group 1